MFNMLSPNTGSMRSKVRQPSRKCIYSEKELGGVVLQAKFRSRRVDGVGLV